MFVYQLILVFFVKLLIPTKSILYYGFRFENQSHDSLHSLSKRHKRAL